MSHQLHRHCNSILLVLLHVVHYRPELLKITKKNSVLQQGSPVFKPKRAQYSFYQLN